MESARRGRAHVFTLTRKKGNVGLLGVKRAPCQSIDLLAVELEVIQLRGNTAITHTLARNRRGTPPERGKPLQVGSLYDEMEIDARRSVSADTDPVVSAHGVEAVGAADKHQVVVPGNQHLDEVVALVLKHSEHPL